MTELGVNEIELMKRLNECIGEYRGELKKEYGNDSVNVCLVIEKILDDCKGGTGFWNKPTPPESAPLIIKIAKIL